MSEIVCQSEEKKDLTHNDLIRLHELLVTIQNAKDEIGQIQGYHHSYSFNRVCEPAVGLVNKHLNMPKLDDI